MFSAYLLFVENYNFRPPMRLKILPQRSMIETLQTYSDKNSSWVKRTGSNLNQPYGSQRIFRSFLKYIDKSIWCTFLSSFIDTKFSSVQFSLSVVSDSLRPHESQHARPPCPSQTPGVYSNSCPWSQWCYPAISSSVVPFSSCPQSLPASGSFQWVSSSHEVAKVLEFQLQHQSF